MNGSSYEVKPCAFGSKICILYTCNPIFSFGSASLSFQSQFQQATKVVKTQEGILELCHEEAKYANYDPRLTELEMTTEFVTCCRQAASLCLGSRL